MKRYKKILLANLIITIVIMAYLVTLAIPYVYRTEPYRPFELNEVDKIEINSIILRRDITEIEETVDLSRMIEEIEIRPKLEGEIGLQTNGTIYITVPIAIQIAYGINIDRNTNTFQIQTIEGVKSFPISKGIVYPIFNKEGADYLNENVNLGDSVIIISRIGLALFKGQVSKKWLNFDLSHGMLPIDIVVYPQGVICYDVLITHLEYGLLFSAIAFVAVWILAFIIWVIVHHLIGFSKWLNQQSKELGERK